jgi:hypothetical protein
LDLAFCMIILRLCVLRLPLVRAADWSLMSVVPQPWPLPVPQVAEAVAAMYGGKRERPLPVLVRDKLGEWLSDEQFAGAYGVLLSDAPDEDDRVVQRDDLFGV